MLLLVAGNPGTMDKLEIHLEEQKRAFAERKRMEEQRDMCPQVEWEQDMGAHIPFCRLTNDFCGMQCMKGETV